MFKLYYLAEQTEIKTVQPTVCNTLYPTSNLETTFVLHYPGSHQVLSVCRVQNFVLWLNNNLRKGKLALPTVTMTSTSNMICAKCGHVLATDIQVPSFPVPDLIHEPRVPSQSEASLIRRTLSGVHADISCLDDEIKRFQETTQELLRVREILSNYAKENEAILTPIERLPPEILSEIFLRLLPPTWGSESNLMVPRKVVMLPGQICRRWRKVALSTPKLYTSITIGREHGSVELEVALIKVWLARSGNLPLSLDYTLFLTRPITDFHPAIDEALPHSDRWKNVSLAYPLSSVRNLGVIKGRLRCLEILTISLEGDLEVQGHQIDAFEIAPQLRSLGFASPIPPHILTVPWPQLTNFNIDIRRYSLEDCLNVLALCPNLATCTLAWDYSPLITRHPPIHLLHLQSLNLEGYSDGSNLFLHLSLPALREFDYLHGDDDVEWNHSEFISLLSRSQCSLQRLLLSMQETFISDVDLIRCLEHSPNLVELELLTDHIFGTPSSALFLLINRPSDNAQSTCLAPKLKKLTLSHHSDFDHLTLANMIQSRWWPEETICNVDNGNDVVERMEKVEIRLHSVMDEDLVDIVPEALEMYRKFREEGLDINLYDDDDMGYFQTL